MAVNQVFLWNFHLFQFKDIQLSTYKKHRLHEKNILFSEIWDLFVIK